MALQVLAARSLAWPTRFVSSVASLAVCATSVMLAGLAAIGFVARRRRSA